MVLIIIQPSTIFALWVVFGQFVDIFGNILGLHMETSAQLFLPFYCMVPITFQRARLRVGIGI